MCPTLSRGNYFLEVINALDRHYVETGSLEEQLQQLLLELAGTVRDRRKLDGALIQRINSSFEAYQAVRLEVRLVSSPEGSLLDASDSQQEDASDEQRIFLHTVYIDGPDELRRMYMESIISLLEAMEKGRVELQNCIQCKGWFIPYQRAQVTRFCSPKCRNRYHYMTRKNEKRECANDYSEVN